MEQQIARLEKAGATEIYTDIQSGTRDDRRQFSQIMDLVKAKLVDEVIVTRIDRLGRSLLSVRKALDQFRAAGVKLTILDGEIDLSTVAGRTHANMMAVFAEMESEMISERSRHGWEYLRSRRVAIHPPFGYVKVGDRHELDHKLFLCLVETKSELSRAAIACDIVETFCCCKSLRATIQQINQKYGLARFHHAGPKTGFATGGLFQWSSSGLSRWLTNPVLRGHLSYLRDTDKPEIIENTHASHRLITDSQFQDISSILSHNRERRGWGMKALKYPLSGLIFCQLCGGQCYSMTAGPRGKDRKIRNYYYYQCKNYQLRACSAKKAIRMDVAEQAVIARLVQRATQIVAIAETPPQYTEPQELLELRSTLARLNGLGHNPAIEVAKADIQSQIQTLLAKSQQQETVDIEKRELLLATFSNSWYWEGLLDENKRQIYSALIKRVIVKDGAVVDVELWV